MTDFEQPLPAPEPNAVFYVIETEFGDYWTGDTGEMCRLLDTRDIYRAAKFSTRWLAFAVLEKIVEPLNPIQAFGWRVVEHAWMDVPAARSGPPAPSPTRRLSTVDMRDALGPCWDLGTRTLTEVTEALNATLASLGGPAPKENK